MGKSLRILAPNGEEFELIKNNTAPAKGGSTNGVASPNRSVLQENNTTSSAESQEENVKRQVKSYAPTFYSKLENEITAMKTDKISANGVVKLLPSSEEMTLMSISQGRCVKGIR